MPVREPYVQQTLLPPEAIEAVLRIGIVNAANHVQYQLEVRNPSDGTLLALESRPAAQLALLGSEAYEWLQRLLDATYVHVSPF